MENSKRSGSVWSDGSVASVPAGRREKTRNSRTLAQRYKRHPDRRRHERGWLSRPTQHDYYRAAAPHSEDQKDNLKLATFVRNTEAGFRTKWLTRTVVGSRRMAGNPNERTASMLTTGVSTGCGESRPDGTRREPRASERSQRRDPPSPLAPGPSSQAGHRQAIAVGLHRRRGRRQRVQRATHTGHTLPRQARVDHRGRHIAVTQQRLHAPDVATPLQQMHGEAVAQRRATGTPAPAQTVDRPPRMARRTDPSWM